MARSRDPKIRIKATNETDKAFKGAQENMRNLASTAAILEGPLGAVAGRINAVGAALGRVNPLVLGAGVAIAGLVAAQSKGIPIAIEYEKQLFRISAQLDLMGASAKFTTQELQGIAEQIARTTLASETGVRNAISALLQFNVGSRDNFTNLLKIAQDMSAVFGGDIVTNVRKLGRAIQDPEKGIETLQRFVPELNNDFRDMVLVMREAGDEAEATAATMDVLLRKFSGVGEKEGKGLAGQIDSMNQSWEILMRNMALTGPWSFVIEQSKLLADNLNKVFFGGEEFGSAKRVQEIQLELIKARQAAEGLAVQMLGGEKLIRDRIEALESEMNAIVQVNLATNANIEATRKRDAASKAADAAARRRNDELDRQFNLAIAQENEYVQELKEEEKQLKKLLPLYSSIRLKILPPLEKLEEEYSRAAAIAAEFGALESQTVEEQRAFQLQVLEKFFNDRNKLENKFSRTDRLISRLEGELTTEEEHVRKVFEKRKAMTMAALADEAGTSEAQKKKLNAILIGLEIQLSEELASVRLSRAAQITGEVSNLIGIAADFFGETSRRETKVVNDEYSKRADIIQENIRKGIISVERGNQQLKALENQRQAQLNIVARKNFEREKKLRRAQAIAAAAQTILGAMADTQGNVYVRIAAGVVAAAAAAKQIHSINTAQFDGGGSIPTVTAGGSAGGSQASGPTETPLRASFVIVGNQNTTFTFDQLVQLAGDLSTLSRDFDIQVVDPDSRNAQDILNSSQGQIAI